MLAPPQTASAFTATLVFSDGSEKQLQVTADETLLTAALNNGVNLRFECKLGTCGTCKAVCSEGEFELETDDGLTVMERRRGYTLTCVMHPRSDCRLEFPYAQEKHAGTQRSASGFVEQIELVSASVYHLSVRIEETASLEFAPGQYVNILVPGTVESRSYSFANPPGAEHLAEFYVRLLDRGVMSDYLRRRARVGDAVRMSGPYGSFYLHDTTLPILMVAGGTGLAPMLSMLDYLIASGRSEQHVRLLFGVNSLQDLFCVEQLERYERSLPHFTYEVAIAEPHAAWPGKIGFVTSLFDPSDLNDGQIEVYVCGPPVMTDATAAWLAASGVPDERIHSEKFLAS